jgi:hypothetical protein
MATSAAVSYQPKKAMMEVTDELSVAAAAVITCQQNKKICLPISNCFFLKFKIETGLHCMMVLCLCKMSKSTI